MTMNKVERVQQLDPMVSMLAGQVVSVKEAVQIACTTHAAEDAERIDIKDMQMAETMAKIATRLDIYAVTLDQLQERMGQLKDQLPHFFAECQRIILLAVDLNNDGAALESFMTHHPNATTIRQLSDVMLDAAPPPVAPMLYAVTAASVRKVRDETGETGVACKCALYHTRGHINDAIHRIKGQRYGYYSTQEAMREAMRIQALAAPAPALPPAEGETVKIESRAGMQSTIPEAALKIRMESSPALSQQQRRDAGIDTAPSSPVGVFNSPFIVPAEPAPAPSSNSFEGGGGSFDGGGASGDY